MEIPINGATESYQQKHVSKIFRANPFWKLETSCQTQPLLRFLRSQIQINQPQIFLGSLLFPFKISLISLSLVLHNKMKKQRKKILQSRFLSEMN